MNVQVIMQDDRPAFAVIPFAQYEQLLQRAEMAEKQADKLTRRRRDYKYVMIVPLLKRGGISQKTQKEVAAVWELQSAYSQIENAESNQKHPGKSKQGTRSGSRTTYARGLILSRIRR